MPRKADFLPDTNVLLRYLLKDDPEQFSRAEEFFEKIREGKERAILLEGVLVECLYVLTKHYQVSPAEAAHALEGLLHYKGIVNPDKDVLAEGLRSFAVEDLDPVDCFLLARARVEKLRIFSFDKKLNKTAQKSSGKPSV